MMLVKSYRRLDSSLHSRIDCRVSACQAQWPRVTSSACCYVQITKERRIIHFPLLLVHFRS